MELKININYLLKALSSKTKARILIHLFSCNCQQCNVNELTEIFKLSQPCLSKHLSDLLKNNLVSVDILKVQRIYKLNHIVRKNYKKLFKHLMCYKEFADFVLISQSKN